MLPVIEYFSSLQGESTHAGRRCFFIRLAGCNLRCSYCDTVYGWSGGTDFSIEKLTALAVESGLPLVEVTGGEPLLHAETPALLQNLLDAGLEVLLETNGSCDISKVPVNCRKIVDCKLPSSGMADKHLRENYLYIQKHDEIKFVTASTDDFEYAVNEIRQYGLEKLTPNLIFSPVWGKISFEKLAELVINSRLNIRMQLQMHKLIWGDKKGV